MTSVSTLLAARGLKAAAGRNPSQSPGSRERRKITYRCGRLGLRPDRLLPGGTRAGSIEPHVRLRREDGSGWTLPRFCSCPGRGQTLRRDSVCTRCSEKPAGAIPVPGAGPPEPRGFGCMGIWAPLQGHLCHFLQHTEVVRRGSCKGPTVLGTRIASEERRQPRPGSCPQGSASNAEGSALSLPPAHSLRSFSHHHQLLCLLHLPALPSAPVSAEQRGPSRGGTRPAGALAIGRTSGSWSCGARRQGPGLPSRGQEGQ